MSERTIAGVVPPRHSESGPAPVSGRVRRELPLPELAGSPDATSRVSAVASVDSRGRISDRSVIRSLGWVAGQRLDIRAMAGSVLVACHEDGVFSLTSQGHLRLPAAVRHWCALQPGARVLIASEPAHSALAVHTMPVLDTMLAEPHTRMFGGGHA